ncbi:hypothetical protein [Flavobacterium cheniae]|nr:hypothetical protein [Flavobacterium cheniae]
MKKTIIMLISVIALVSCGKDKKEVKDNTVVQVVDKYSLEIDAIYEKNDSINVFYKMDGYFQYEKPISATIKGSQMPQKVKVQIPEGIAIENIKIEVSTNKEQEGLTVQNISILNNDKVVIDGSNGKHSEYFLTDESFTWDLEKSRFKLNHSNKYPPGLLGNELTESLLTK